MRASTRKRIEALETQARATHERAAEPAIVLELDERGHRADPIFVELDGQRWEQRPGEAREDFKQRVLADVAKLPRHLDAHHVRIVVLQRPRLTLEKWRDKHGIEAAPAGLGEPDDGDH